MDFESAVKPEMLEFLKKTPDGLMTSIGEDPPAARGAFDQLRQQLFSQMPDYPVQVTETRFPGPDGDVPHPDRGGRAACHGWHTGYEPTLESPSRHRRRPGTSHT